MRKKINRVVCVGGTHGDELTGIYLIKKFERYSNLVRRPSFETTTLLGNPGAIAAGRRYLERDLNRCFSPSDLADISLRSYEDNRAKELSKLLNSEDNAADFIVDLHTTTAHMGQSIVLTNTHCFNLQLAGYLCSINPSLRVFLWDSPGQGNFLNSLCECGFAIEVGPVPGGCLTSQAFQQTEELIGSILDSIEAFNNDRLPKQPLFYLYKHVSTLDYPRNEHGELVAMIHPQILDFKPLNPGDPVFLSFDNKTITYAGSETVYPCFVNEKSYYEKGIAMCLTRQHKVMLSD